MFLLCSIIHNTTTERTSTNKCKAMQSVLLVLISKSEETQCQQGKKCCEKFKMH